MRNDLGRIQNRIRPSLHEPKMKNWLRRRRLPLEEVQVERGDAGRRVAVIFVGDDMLDVNRGEVDLLRICFDMGVTNGVSSHHLRQSRYVMGRFDTRAMGKDFERDEQPHEDLHQHILLE